MKFTQFTWGYIIHPTLKTFTAVALSLCLLGTSAAQSVAVSDATHDQNRSSSTHSGTKWEVRAGDTLAGIARSFYPDNAPMRDRLTRAIIAANPGISTDGKPAQVVVGSVLIIPDLRTIGSATAGTASEVPGAAQQPPPPRKPKPVTVKSSEGMGAAAVATVDKPVTTATPKQVKPAAESPPPPTALQEQTAPGKSGTGVGGFRLKLSTGAMDLSVIGKLSEEELKRRREGQLLLDADDPMASFLALRRQIKHLETQVEELQLKLDLGKNKASLPAPATAPAEATVATAPVVTKPVVTSPASIPFIPAAHAPVPTNDTLELVKYALTLYLLPAAEITLAILALFFVLRYYRNLRARLAESGELTESENRRLFILAKAREATADISGFDKNVAISTAANIEVVEDTGIEVILQDAQLFVIHGYPDKAIELLEEQIAANHEEVRVWMLLFVILRSQGIKEEFEKFARRFRTLIHDQSMWENIQDLGRELEPANALYLNKRNRRLANTSTPGATAEMKAGASSPDDTQEFKVILGVSKNISKEAPPDDKAS